MKISVTSIEKFALLTLAIVLAMTAFVHDAKAQSVIDVSGTTWVGTDSDGDYYEYTFQADGVLHYKSPSGTYTNGTWKQNGSSIYMETNNKYSEYQGRITGTHMEGNAWNIKGRTWTWVADMRGVPASPANSNTPSLAGTSWNVVETNGDRDIYNFLPDGTLNYSYQNGTYSNGTWKQDGDSIYIEMNHKYVEYSGQVTGTHVEGKAWNVKGKTWTWTADKR